MKIEKLTENKIRVIVSIKDLEKSNTDLHSIMTKALEAQGLVLEILSKAEKEVGFNTEGCKLLIEAFSSSDDMFIFTITKYQIQQKENDITSPSISNKKLTVKRKSININNTTAFFTFDSFDNFCNFCHCILNIRELNLKNICKNTSLYLVLNNINTNYYLLNRFYSTISEFGKVVNYSKQFENKLLEHSTTIIKKDAINIASKYFSNT